MDPKNKYLGGGVYASVQGQHVRLAYFGPTSVREDPRGVVYLDGEARRALATYLLELEAAEDGADQDRETGTPATA